VPDRSVYLRRRLVAGAVLLVLVAAGVALARGGGSDGEPTRAGGPTPSATTASRSTDAPRLTVRQLVGQRLIASFRGSEAPPQALVERIRRGELAGVILFAENAPSIARARATADRLQKIPRPNGLRAPLLVMIDQEGGLVRRLPDAPPARSARQMSADGVDGVFRAGRETGRALRRAGVNVNLAPVADVPRAGSALAREQRTFGRTKTRVAQLAGAFARGLVAAKVNATAKHFPGFGAATVNTDDAPATIGLSKAALRRADYAAVRAVVREGASLVMLSNAIYPSLDPRRPATLSEAIATGELRDALGFKGVAVTDDLEANALRRFGGPGELATLSATAGADLLLFGRTYAATEAAAQGLERAVASGRISRASLQASADRVLALRTTIGA
jgi:beta-N-acetylhexosaminidase